MQHIHLTPLEKLRAYLETADLGEDGRLPSERELAETLDMGRTVLRKALATLQGEGVVWRHVGKGTFVGERPIESISDINALVLRTNPTEVMAARLAFEPEIARLAAVNATGSQINDLRACAQKCRQAATWRQYEHYDNRLHRIIGEATQNSLLLGLLDTMTTVRRAVTWGRPRNNPGRPPRDHHSFEQHDRIVEAIAARDGQAAADAMRAHLRTVEQNLRNSLGY
ncbi:MAG TPA: FadR/GntR family transcriptional regulator [Paracoccus sp. (in: a-proteobacteria)]|uniref:FadR/GntR family transcriptional regulator n=1 Tax=Paracoccus sp. TaxID=267 RepID=UPI002BC0B3ED|nr:FadR/GntR family transcriptional regulator [Paracoccus sp. (in: a-proteobacteria)]HWL58282.1 FadR/GntR family transcriptional regulator [Paracoccus sp. (in: a-proteobacteria)]